MNWSIAVWSAAGTVFVGPPQAWRDSATTIASIIACTPAHVKIRLANISTSQVRVTDRFSASLDPSADPGYSQPAGGWQRFRNAE